MILSFIIRWISNATKYIVLCKVNYILTHGSWIYIFAKIDSIQLKAKTNYRKAWNNFLLFSWSGFLPYGYNQPGPFSTRGPFFTVGYGKRIHLLRRSIYNLPPARRTSLRKRIIIGRRRNANVSAAHVYTSDNHTFNCEVLQGRAVADYNFMPVDFPKRHTKNKHSCYEPSRMCA